MKSLLSHYLAAVRVTDQMVALERTGRYLDRAIAAVLEAEDAIRLHVKIAAGVDPSRAVEYPVAAYLDGALGLSSPRATTITSSSNSTSSILGISSGVSDYRGRPPVGRHTGFTSWEHLRLPRIMPEACGNGIAVARRPSRPHIDPIMLSAPLKISSLLSPSVKARPMLIAGHDAGMPRGVANGHLGIQSSRPESPAESRRAAVTRRRPCEHAEHSWGARLGARLGDQPELPTLERSHHALRLLGLQLLLQAAHRPYNVPASPCRFVRGGPGRNPPLAAPCDPRGSGRSPMCAIMDT